MSTERLTWVDIAKGIGIIAVVFGHYASDNLAHHYTYWFHMPLFFILSGLLFNPLDNFSQLWPWILKRTKQLMIPYLSFGIIILLYKAIMHENYYDDFGLTVFLEDFYNFVYGGLAMKGINTVFWFITCLLLTQIVFAVIRLCIKSVPVQLGIVVLSYFWAHAYSIYIAGDLETPVPWSADVVFIALAYYALGFYLRQYLSLLLNFKAFVMALIFTIGFTVYDFRNGYFYEMDLKPNVYEHVVLDFLVPFSICIIVFCISKQLAQFKASKFLISLGMSSLTIMFLHRITNEFAAEFFEYEIITFTLIGLLAPFALHYLFEKTAITRLIFLGKSTKVKNTSKSTKASA